MYLLDTHVLLWWFNDPARLTPKARGVIEDGASTVFVSSASTWEIVIKRSLGKLVAPDRIFDLVETYFSELPITITHTKALANLNRLHDDPFDRLLIAQALADRLTLITSDKRIRQYDVRTLAA